MKQPHTRDFLIRNMPIEIYTRLEEAAQEHHRSKTQEAIVAISTGLLTYRRPIKLPTPMKWGKKITNTFIQEAIDEGRA